MTFGRVLREAGLEVGPGRICDAMSGLDLVGLGRRDDVYWTLRQTLVSRADDIGAFARFSWNDGRSEILAFTDIDTSFSKIWEQVGQRYS